MGLMIVEGWGCIPDPFWQAWWKSHPYETVMIDGEYWPMSVSMYELYLFQLTLPVWGATARSLALFLLTLISTHAPRVGSDPASKTSISPIRYFNSRSPCGERLLAGNMPASAHIISTHAPRVGSDTGQVFGGPC